MSGVRRRHGNMPPPNSNGRDLVIRDVWASNLEDEMNLIRATVVKYPYVAMDTEFPGVVATPLGQFRGKADHNFQTMVCNVNMLKLIQLGLAFFDEEGNRPQGCFCWQFNFQFSLTSDMYSKGSIEFLQRTGMNFPRHDSDGIDPLVFAELLTTSGLVMCDDVTWITFSSGYDFGYLIRLLMGELLPQSEKAFFELLRIFFPVMYDVKYLMKSCKMLKGGLQVVADALQVQRIGMEHTGGSDAILTGSVFFKMLELFFEGLLDKEKFNQMLYGIGLS